MNEIDAVIAGGSPATDPDVPCTCSIHDPDYDSCATYSQNQKTCEAKSECGKILITPGKDGEDNKVEKLPSPCTWREQVGCNCPKEKEYFELLKGVDPSYASVYKKCTRIKECPGKAWSCGSHQCEYKCKLEDPYGKWYGQRTFPNEKFDCIPELKTK